MGYLRCSCVVLIFFLSGCYREHTFDQEVIIRPGTKGFAFEVQN